MALVDGKGADPDVVIDFAQEVQRALGLFGRQVHEGVVAPHGLLRLLPRGVRREGHGRDAVALEPHHLVLHERDERGDDHGHSLEPLQLAQRQARELVGERLRAGGRGAKCMDVSERARAAIP